MGPNRKTFKILKLVHAQKNLSTWKLQVFSNKNKRRLNLVTIEQNLFLSIFAFMERASDSEGAPIYEYKRIEAREDRLSPTVR